MHKSSRLPAGLIPAVVTALLLSIPLIAMQFTAQVQWSPIDFLVMGLLLFGCGLALDLLLRREGSWVHRLAITGAILSTLLMTWANMAVGLLAGESNLHNAWLLIVPVLGVVGALAVRLRPLGMAWTLVSMAVVQGVLTGIAAAEGWRPLWRGPIDIWGPNAFFMLLFLGAAVLFAVAAAERAGADSATRSRPLLPALMLLVIGATIGALGIYVGQIDDAPGAGALGLLALFASAAIAWRLVRGR